MNYWIRIHAINNPPWLEQFFEMNHALVMKYKTFKLSYVGYESLLRIRAYQEKHS